MGFFVHAADTSGATDLADHFNDENMLVIGPRASARCCLNAVIGATSERDAPRDSRAVIN